MEPIQIHCDCCDLDDITAADYDALAAALGQAAPADTQED